MKTYTEQLEELRESAIQSLIPKMDDEGELHFSERQISLEGGGWRQETYLDLDGLYELSTVDICDLADELI